ncbi:MULTISPECIES: hypothetical protein [unclassified Maridesulfovibrio]|uniref:hypothetical protein n=1 Tax=unclassified Maridesulfovibrio TaxID=2794999 RepID=UPI003B41E623
MQSKEIREPLLKRKIELKQFLIAHPIPAEILKKAADEVGMTVASFRGYFLRETAPERVCNKIVEIGIPKRLAPFPSIGKLDMVSMIRNLTVKNEKLDSENKDLRSRLTACGCEVRETPKNTGV